MGKVVNVKEQLITTNSGMKFIRRTKTVEMPNGRYRYPVEYYDASPEPVRITQEERERRHIPIYEPAIWCTKSYVKDMSDYVNKINDCVERAMFEQISPTKS